MDKLLRFLRMITFTGASFVFVYILVYDVPITSILSAAFHPVGFKDGFYCFISWSLIAYPILFVLSVIYLKIHYGGVNLIWSTTDSVGLFQMFLQNEVMLLSNIIFEIHSNIFTHNSNWLGASFIGFFDSKGIKRVIRRTIGYIAYAITPILFHIFFLAIICGVYYGLLVFFLH